MIGGMSGITGDVPPLYSNGNRAKLNGLNIVGLKRNRLVKLKFQNYEKYTTIYLVVMN